MAASHSDPRILYSVNNIRAFHIQNGEESELTASGPQTLSLLMVPTATPYEDEKPGEDAAEEDFYLHLHLPPELDMPLPATSQIYHQPPDSYLIPRWDLGPDAGAFIKLKFPSIGSSEGKVTQEDVDTFETILAQCTAFLERAAPPGDHAKYNPADYAPGEGYVSSPSVDPPKRHGHIVLVDEEDGSVVGEVSEGYQVVEEPNVKPGSKRPVEIQLPAEGEGTKISVSNVSEDYLRMSRHPAYQKSTIVQTSAMASRLIVTGSTKIANALLTRADTFTQTTKPNPKPITFSPAAHDRIRKINYISSSALGLSSKTVGQIERVAQNLGATLSRRKGIEASSGRQGGEPSADFKPGVMNKTLIAFNTLMDGLEQGARTLLNTGGDAVHTVVEHRYGPDMGAVARNLGGGFRNVGLVYVDATGVSRRAILKSVAKGMVVGRMHDGQQVVVGGGDGGQVPPNVAGSSSGKSEYGYYGGNGLNPNQPSSSSSRDPVVRRPSPTPTPPPPYGAPGTYSLGGSQPGPAKR